MIREALLEGWTKISGYRMKMDGDKIVVWHASGKSDYKFGTQLAGESFWFTPARSYWPESLTFFDGYIDLIDGKYIEGELPSNEYWMMVRNTNDGWVEIYTPFDIGKLPRLIVTPDFKIVDSGGTRLSYLKHTVLIAASAEIKPRAVEEAKWVKIMGKTMQEYFFTRISKVPAASRLRPGLWLAGKKEKNVYVVLRTTEGAKVLPGIWRTRRTEWIEISEVAFSYDGKLYALQKHASSVTEIKQFLAEELGLAGR